MKKSAKSDPLAERPALDFSKGVRGKYFNRLQQGTNVAILDADVVDHFPDSESVNNALRAFLAIGQEVQSASIRVLRGATPARMAKRADSPKAKRAYSFDPRKGIAFDARSAAK